MVKRLDDRGQLRLIAEAGVKKAIVELAKQEEKSYDSLKDAWTNDIGAFKDSRVGEGRFTVYYNYVDEWVGTSETRYGVVDEERKININTSDRAVLERLFKVVLDLDGTEAQELAASIVDWRDADSELSIPLGSAEDSFYRALSYPYEAKDANFDVLEELLLVKGVTKEIFEKIKDYITIYGGGKVNINTAPKAVLSALGLSGDIVNKIMEFRYGKDEVLGTPDDGVFNSPSDIVPVLSQSHSLGSSEVAQLTTVAEQCLSASSNNFTARSAARLVNRKNTLEATAVINRSGKILSWRES